MPAAAAKLGEVLGDRHILLIIDDAWREQDLRPFLQGARYTTRLVTTRIDSVLPDNAIRQPVPAEDVAKERLNFEKLAQRLGEWAQLLKIVNGFLLAIASSIIVSECQRR
ncbi:hypothetical protein [Methylocystis sp.]|uniref:hypothetical protein n=1 Tax=Methylocystis sp. TaxID=1911079 RepID=UPI003DA376B3